ncbi:MAG TPA: AI-2E family transporter [Pyrinomonadaceae bacterium]|nr:AI-2E family transporter [Pyrinomonadaceae bacterium]
MTPPKHSESLAFARRVLIATLVVVSVMLVLLLIWYAADLLMLVFAAVLISILLRSLTDFLTSRTQISHGLALAIVSLALVVSIAVTAWLVTGRIGAQLNQLRVLLPQAFQNVATYLSQYEWGRNAISSLPDWNQWLASRGGTIISRLGGFASTTLGAIINTLVVFIIGLYLASQPDLYSRGLKRLVPFGYRERAEEVLGVMESALERWIMGRLGLMIMNGILTAIGLWILGVPLAFTLGLLAGILNFVPNFGPLIAAIPAVLIAFMKSPQHALYVTILYIVLQSVDGYILTPLVDRRSVELPPVLTIAAQVLLGLAFGFVGILLASPLTAVAMILVKMIYVEDLLGDNVMLKVEEESEEEEAQETVAADR